MELMNYIIYVFDDNSNNESCLHSLRGYSVKAIQLSTQNYQFHQFFLILNTSTLLTIRKD